MGLAFEWFISRRYVFSRKRERLTGVIANISVLAIAIGVAALIVVIAVMTGFQQILKEKILSVNPHVVVEKVQGPFVEYEGLEQKIRTFFEENDFPLESLYPFVSLQGLLLSGQGEAGVILKGLPFSKAKELKTLRLISGNFTASSQSPYPILLGKRLAERLGVTVGDRVRFLYPRGRMTPIGLLPRFVPFEVAGIFETGLYDYDLSLALVPLSVAQKISGEGKRVTGLEIKLVDPFLSREVVQKLSRSLGYTYYVVDWQTLNRSLFSALKLEKTGMFVVLTLIVVVAAFNIVAALVMLVSEKRPDIALLKALGATEKNILRIFLFSGFLLGIMGTALGLILGLSLCAVLSRYPVIKLPGDVYPVDYLPVRVEFLDVATIVFSALILSLLAAIFPARQAAKLPPAEVLRYG
ncbi:lipoprotein-releasing ABC transporter permease subunit [Thermosulfurimonas dismutans]|uniref:Lipoprotein releasing system transmembrane protein LolE n=1 Tax=Thermosulfurimonas dismutans TaxID=999894 RepID=A0A179D470_9BACT|nr:lipoprotein-releasing ABC transporter permease subunit [Thermosulfurimonas dismutans]OAQ20519.1 Lipoprotein releasing system transmembrane protein LolE [Thermosulfurimonas dismutans]